MDRTRAIPESAPLIRVNSSGEAERGVAKAGPAAVGVLVFLVAIGLAGEGSHGIRTPHSSGERPIDSRAANWRAAPMPLAPVGTGGTDRTPPARYGHAMAYDSQSDRLVLFGGASTSAGVLLLLNDTWAYAFNTSTWTDMSPAIAPPARYGHAIAYDSESDRVILFGGSSYGNAVFNDTWAYDFNTNTWNEVSPKSSPLARSYHVTAYDSESDRVILFGGYSSCCGGITLGDTGTYDCNTDTWTAMIPAVAPGPRESSAMAYDSRSDRVILFGGYGGYNDTWAYDFNTNTWTDTT